jgi:hypothetical protein
VAGGRSPKQMIDAAQNATRWRFIEDRVQLFYDYYDLQKQPLIENSGLGVERPAAFYYSGDLQPMRTDMVLGIDASIIGGANEQDGETFDTLFSTGFNVISANAADVLTFRRFLQRGSAHGVFIVAAPPTSAPVLTSHALDRIKAEFSCNPYFGGFVFSANASTSSVPAVAEIGSHARVVAPNLLPVSLSATPETALATLSAIPTAAVRVGASLSAHQTLHIYAKMLSGLQTRNFTWWAVLDACSSPNKAALRLQAYASFVFGAKSLWASASLSSGGSAQSCDAVQFATLSRIGKTLTRIGNILLGLRVEKIYTSVPTLLADRSLQFVAPATGELVVRADVDLIVAMLTPTVANATTPPVPIQLCRVSVYLGTF